MPLIDTANESIILASKSPRRIELLKKVITHFEVQASHIDEDTIDSREPEKLVIDLSRRKAEVVAKKIDTAIVIGADSVVVYKGDVLGKPRNFEHSFNMLNMLSDNEHHVYTGITVIKKPEQIIKSDYSATKVKFRKLSHWEIEKYIRTNQPFDKAGSYGIQDDAAVFVESIEGCYYNVMGLPVTRLYTMLVKLLKPNTVPN